MPLTPAEQTRANVLIAEMARPARGDAARFVDAATRDVPWQREFVYDASPRKALFGERRGGKTSLMGICGIEKALAKPNSKTVYIGLTMDSCQRVFYDEVLERFRRRYELPFTLVGGDTARFENGSFLYLIGLDATKKQKEKVRGIKAALILIDEMQSYTQDTRLIINEILGPAAADTKAQTIIGGTAGNSLGKNYWYEITEANDREHPIAPSTKHPEWMVYRCEWSRNTAVDDITGRRVCDNVREYLAEQVAQHPGIDRTDSWLQEWEAKWVILTSSLIYRFSAANQVGHPSCVDLGTGSAVSLPSEAFLAGASKILGLDLGYNDPTAMTVIAYNTQFSNRLYVVETFKQSGMLIGAVAQKVKDLDAEHHFDYIVGDSSSLQVFESLQQQYGLVIQKANRAGKLSHQLMLNGDLQTNVVVILPGNEELVKQLETCKWEAKALAEGKYVEDPKDPNDLADSFLYAHTFSRSLWYNAPRKAKPPTNASITAELSRRLIEANQGGFANGGDYNGDIYEQ